MKNRVRQRQKRKKFDKDRDIKNVDVSKRAKTASNRKSVPGAYRNNIFTPEKGPGGGELQGPMHPKAVNFEGTLLRIVFQKCASHRGRGASF